MPPRTIAVLCAVIPALGLLLIAYNGITQLFPGVVLGLLPRRVRSPWAPESLPGSSR